MENRAYAMDNYRMRIFMALTIIIMAFGFYFCWEVLYQERVIVNLLAFTQMERSREAAQGKNYLHDWIPSHEDDDEGARAHQVGLRSEYFDQQGAPLALNHVPKTSADFAQQEAALAEAVRQRGGLDFVHMRAALQEATARLTVTYMQPTDALQQAETGGDITGDPLVKDLEENKDGGMPRHFRKNLDTILKAARRNRNEGRTTGN